MYAQNHPPKELDGYLRAVFQAFDKRPEKSVTMLSDGVDHACIVLDDHWVFRFPKTSKVASRFKHELAVLQNLPNDLKRWVPRYEYINTTASFGGYQFFVGDQLNPDLFIRSTKASQTTFAQKIAHVMKGVHSGLEPLEEYHVDFRRRYVRRYFGTMRERVASSAPVEVLRLLDQFYLGLWEIGPGRRTLVHGDISERHIYVTARDGHLQLSGVIDFGDAAWADPAVDLAGFGPYGRDFLAEILLSYQIDDDQSLFERAVWYYARRVAQEICFSILNGAEFRLRCERLNRLFVRLKLGQISDF